MHAAARRCLSTATKPAASFAYSVMPTTASALSSSAAAASACCSAPLIAAPAALVRYRTAAAPPARVVYRTRLRHSESLELRSATRWPVAQCHQWQSRRIGGLGPGGLSSVASRRFVSSRLAEARRGRRASGGRLCARMASHGHHHSHSQSHGGGAVAGPMGAYRTRTVEFNRLRDAARASSRPFGAAGSCPVVEMWRTRTLREGGRTHRPCAAARAQTIRARRMTPAGCSPRRWTPGARSRPRICALRARARSAQPACLTRAPPLATAAPEPGTASEGANAGCPSPPCRAPRPHLPARPV